MRSTELRTRFKQARIAFEQKQSTQERTQL